MFLFFVYVVPFVSGLTFALAVFLFTRYRIAKKCLEEYRRHTDRLCERVCELEVQLAELQEHVNGSEESEPLAQRVEALETTAKVLQLTSIVHSVGGLILAKRL